METMYKLFNLLVKLGIGFTLGDFFYGSFAVLVLSFPMSYPVGIITGLMGIATYYSYMFLKSKFKK